MVYRISNLPSPSSTITGKTIRGFEVCPETARLKKGSIPLREGLTLNEMLKKLGLCENANLAKLGINIGEKMIDISALRQAIKSRGRIVDHIEIRRGERKNPQKIFEAVIGRLGSEDGVLEFNIIRALKNTTYRSDKAILLYNYTQHLYSDDVIAQGKSMIALAEKLCPDNKEEQEKLMVAVVVSIIDQKLYPEKHSLEFIKGLALLSL